MHQTVTLQFRIRPDRQLSAAVWNRKQRYNQGFNAGIAYLLAHEERDGKGYRRPGLKGQGLYKELKHLRQTDPDFAGMSSRDLYTGLRDAGNTYELWRRGCNTKRRARIAHRHRLAEYRSEPVIQDGPRKGQPKRPPKPPDHRFSPPESLYRHRKDREQAESYGKRFAYPSAYKPEIRGRHRIMLPGLGVVIIQGTIKARLRDLFPGRNGLSWRLLAGYHMVDITRKITRRTRPCDRRYNLHLQVEVEFPAPKCPDNPVVIGCEPGVRIDLAVVRDQGGTAYAFRAPKGLKREHGDESDRLRSARSVNTRKGSRKYKRLSREMAKVSRRRTNRTVEWERHVACEVEAMGDVIGMSDLNLHSLTKSGKGTGKRPHRNAGTTRRRNRALRYARPGALRAAVAARATKQGTPVHSIDPKLSGQRCAACGYTSKDNREKQVVFNCKQCGYRAHDAVNTARNFAAAARVAWQEEPGACPVPREREGGRSTLLTGASAPVMERPGRSARRRSLAVPLSNPRKPPEPRGSADLDSPIRRGSPRPQ